MRTYRPVPVTLRVWVPPVPVLVEKIEVQFTASGDVWIWNALPYAVSQFRTTLQICWLDPRSTWSHCGSLKALDQRVPVLPSTAFAAGNPAFSVEDAVAALLSAMFVVPHPPPPPPLGAVHFCWAEPVQVSMSSREPVLPPGSVRHRLEFGLTSSPLD